MWLPQHRFTRVGFSPQHWWRQKLRPEMKRLHPVHSLMLLFVLFFVSDMKLSTFTSELFAALFTILVLNQYIVSRLHSCRRWLPCSTGSHILTRHLIGAWWRHHCSVYVRSDDKYLKEVSPENLLKEFDRGVG